MNTLRIQKSGNKRKPKKKRNKKQNIYNVPESKEILEHTTLNMLNISVHRIQKQI